VGLARPKQISKIVGASVLLWVLVADPREASPQRLPIKAYTTADGLARDRVTRIRKDSRGFLWFCTEEGLSRFDGYHFTNYTTSDGLPSSTVWDFLETRTGDYWIGTLRGLCRFNPYLAPSNTGNRMFTTYEPDDGKETLFGALFEDSRGIVWCGSSRGVYRLEQEGGDWRLREENIKASIYNFVEDRQGALWIAADNGLYRRLPDGKVERYTNENGLPSNSIRGLLVHSDGSIWVGTNGGLCQLKRDIGIGTMIVSRLINPYKGNPVGSTWLFEDANHHVWVCGGQGLFELLPDKGDYQARFYSAAQGLSGTFIWSMTEDRDGNPWIATNTGGVMKMARNGLTTWRQDNGLDADFVMGISEDQAGELCLTSRSNKGLLISRFDGEQFKTIQPFYPKGLLPRDDEAQQGILQDRSGEWWIPTGSGLLRYGKAGSLDHLSLSGPKAVYTMKHGLCSNHPFRLFEDSRGDIWIGAFVSSITSGVTRWERKTEKFYRYSLEDGVPGGTPSGFAEDLWGNIWITFHSGVAARSRDGRFTSFRLVSPPPGRRMHDVYSDRAGRVWIGTADSGVFRVDNPNDQQPQFTNYTVKEGLSSNDVWDITDDDLGQIYFATGRGLDRLNPATKQIKHFTTIDGLTSNYVLMVYRDRHGAIWAGTQRGVSRLVPEPDPPSQPPPVFINRIRIAGEQYPMTALGESSVAIPDLSPGQNKLNIDFFGLSLAVGEALRYQYILEGAGADWSEVSERGNVDFANLRPGSYRFVVRAINSDGTASSQPASVTFKILLPIWLRWWFVGLVVFVVAAIFYSFYRYRTARLREVNAALAEAQRAEEALGRSRTERLAELERVRARIATDLHDDIGSSLTQIAILSEVAHQQAGGGASENGSEPIARIISVSNELVDTMSDIVWAINPKKDHLSDLRQRMRRFASDVFTARQIAFHFRAPDSERDIELGANVRREVFLIFKESVNNVVKHSGCTRAELEFQIEGDWLVLKVTDNGKGFDSMLALDDSATVISSAKGGNGLPSMRKRAQEMGGEFQIVSRIGEGTTATLRVLVAHQQAEMK
jgi:ligand-binding sensor domain-containing protein/signal transduction histidine kinase